MTLRPALVTILLSAVAACAQAQGVWRCGSDGKQFSDKPCSQGRTLETLDTRPAADLAAAQDAAQREKSLAAQLTKERQQREAQALPAAGIRSSRPDATVKPKEKAAQKPLKQMSKRRPADDGIWRATAPSSRHRKG
jgi:hypothetical protein